MMIHKWKSRTQEALCGATDYKDAIISHHWLPVTCKKCRVLKRLKPKLASIRRQIASYEKRLKELKSLEKRYQGELGNASK